MAASTVLHPQRRPSGISTVDGKPVPGDRGWPLVGHTPAFLRDARAFQQRQMARYGDVFASTVLGRPGVTFVTPQATRDIYLDRSQVLSSEQGWATSIGGLFRHGLMLRDFDDHRVHRLAMAHAFRRQALSGYVAAIHRVIDRHLDDQLVSADREPVDVYRLMKATTLDMASEVFVGMPLGADAQRVNADFVAMVRAAVTPIRAPIPGTPYAAGMRARRDLETLIGGLVQERRAGGGGTDLLSELSRARTESGEVLTQDEVVDHLIFLLLAAHDTTTATISVLVHELARHPQWQDRVAEEVRALDGADVTLENARTLTLVDRCMKEALRLTPPVPFSPRVTTAEVTIDGWTFAAGTPVSATSLSLHRHPGWWTAPDTFDPDRFAPERAEDKQHSHLFVPFGGGAHLCIGNHLAELITKAVVARLLRAHRLSTPTDGVVEMAPVPIPKPRRPLLVQLS